MNTPRIWCYFCALFLLYAIIILSRERQEIVFAPVHNRNEPYDYCTCVDLKNKLFANKTQLDLQKFNRELYLYFYKRNNGDTSYNATILNAIRRRSYFFFKDYFCILVKKQMQWYIKSFIGGHYFIFKPYELFRLTEDLQRADADQLVVINKEWPFSNCLKNYSKFRCLNACQKERHRLSKYFYNGSENGIVHLVYDYNETIKASEYLCLDGCHYDDCKVSAFEKSYNPEQRKTIVYEAKFMMSDFNYWAQLLGLLALHLSISSYQLLSKLTEFVFLKLEKLRRFKKKKKKVHLFRNIFKMTILLVIVGCLLYQTVEMIRDFHHETRNVTGEEMKTYLFAPEPFSLCLCLPMTAIFYQNYNLYLSVKNITLLDLERISNSLINNLINEKSLEIFMKFEEQRSEVNWVLTPKVFFKANPSTGHFSRCFKIDVRPSEPSYQSLLASSKLIIKFKIYLYAGEDQLYLLPEGQNCNSKSLQLTRGKFWKKIVKGSNCVDYNREGCGNRVDCLERCINREVFERHGQINSHLFVDKDQYSKKIWQSSSLGDDFGDYKEIERKCSQKYSNEGCNEISFESTEKPHKVGQTNELDLFFDVITVLKNQPSVYSLVIDILNIQSLLLGLNLFKLLMMIYGYTAVRCRFARSKLHLIFIYLLVLPGFVYHLYSLFDGVLHAELVHYNSYLLLNSVQLPEVIFCVNYDQKIDRNHQLTRSYLDRLTEKHLKIEDVFDRFDYLNEINEWVTVMSEGDKRLQVSTFYLAIARKCFRVKLEVRYKLLQFNFAEDKKVLKIFFNEEFVNRNPKVLFFTKTRNPMQFSKLNNFEIYETIGDYKIKNRYSIFQNHLFVSINDKFYSLKHPLSLFSQECDSHRKDLHELNDEFERNFCLRTLKLPVEDGGDFPVDDDAFDQFYKQLHNTTNDVNSNIERKFVTTLFKKKVVSGLNVTDPDLSNFNFHLNFLVQSIKLTNEDNVVKLLISILNVLSLWLDKSILDLPACFGPIYTVFTFLYRSIEKMHHFLKRTLLCSLENH